MFIPASLARRIEYLRELRGKAAKIKEKRETPSVS